jgi:hypothetical protein
MPTPVIDWSKLKNRWPHLDDVPVQESGGKTDVLVGLDHSNLLAVLESRVGGERETFASRTRLGWVVRGLLGSDIGPMTTAHIHHISATSESSLDEEFQTICTAENFGTELKGDGLSEADRIVEKIVDEDLKKLDIGYETPLSWLEGEPTFENSRKLAEHRLRDLKEVAGMLNRRPHPLASNDPEDLGSIAARKFLNLPATSDLPAGDIRRALPRDHIRYVKKMANLFRDLWTKIFLPALVPRRKWVAEERNFEVGDSIMLSDNNWLPNQWKAGRIIEVCPGSDGFVRVVKVKTDCGEYLRPTHRLVLLEPYSAVLPSASGENVPEKKNV